MCGAGLTGTPAPTLRHFVHRRVLKIVPSYYLAVGLMLCLLPQPGIAPGREWFHLLTHLCFIHNWFFETGGSIAGVLWSLATEVQFYAVFPLLMLALRRSPVVTIAGMVAVAVVWRVICLRILFVADGGEALLAWRGEQLPARLDIFAAGMAAAYAHVWARQNAPHRKWFAPGLAGVALLAFAALVWQMQTYYGVSRAGTPVDVVAMRGRLLLAATLFVLGFGGSLAPHRFQQAAANPVLSLLSQVSYNLYLWHQPLALWLLSHHLPPTQTPDPHGDPVWQWRFTLLAWAVGIVVAAVLTVGWETPFLRGKLPGFGRKR